MSAILVLGYLDISLPTSLRLFFLLLNNSNKPLSNKKIPRRLRFKEMKTEAAALRERLTRIDVIVTYLAHDQ